MHREAPECLAHGAVIRRLPFRFVRVVVSGAAGFLGSHLSRALLHRGDEVIGIDNLITGDLDNVEDLLGTGAFRFLKHDVSDYTHVGGPVDVVVHMASPASPKDFSEIPIKIMKANGMGSHRLLGLALEKRARFVLASTSEVYGDPLVHPQPETYWGNVNPIGGRSMYDEAKRFAEALTFAYKRKHGLSVGVVRTFNTYGEGMKLDDGRVVTNFVVQALRSEPITLYGDGSQTRSFCYVSDQIAGYIAMIDAAEVSGPINIGNPNEFTVLQLAEIVLELTGSTSPLVRLPLPSDDPLQRCPDITRAEEALGWRPTVELREGLGRTIDHVRGRLEAVG